MKVLSKLYSAYGEATQAEVIVYLTHNEQPTIVEMWASRAKGYWEIHGGKARHVSKEAGNRNYSANVSGGCKHGLNEVFDKGNFQKRLTIALKELDKADWLEAEFSYC